MDFNQLPNKFKDMFVLKDNVIKQRQSSKKIPSIQKAKDDLNTEYFWYDEIDPDKCPKRLLRKKAFLLLNNIVKEDMICKRKECNNTIKINRDALFKNEYCSGSCSAKDDIIKRKQEKTNTSRYGVKHVSQHKEIRQKQKEVCKERFGFEYCTQNSEIAKKISDSNKVIMNKPEIIERIKNTNLEKYGVPIYAKTKKFKEFMKENKEDIQTKKINNSLEKYGVPYPSQSIENKDMFISKEEYLKRLENKNKAYINKNFINDSNHFKLKEFCEYFHCSHSSAYIFLKENNIKYSKHSGTSSYEYEIIEYLKSLDPELIIISNSRDIIKPLELDIYLPSLNLAIEFNGLYWHSYNEFKNSSPGKNKNYFKKRHLLKTQYCEAKNINLLHINENEFRDPIKKEVWKSVLKYKIGKIENKYMARKTVVKEIKDKSLVSSFFNKNHLQGGKAPGSIALGLYLKENDTLISIMTFGKSRYSRNHTYELIRFSTLLNTSCTGGAQKILKYFKNNIMNSGESLISYANRRWASSISNVYKSTGFTFLRESEPNYFYTDDLNSNILYSRVQFQKHKLSKLPKTQEFYKDNLPEMEIMNLAGYRSIWDAGNLVYEFKKD